MAGEVGEFTKGNAKNMREAVKEMFDAIPKAKRMEFIGHFNELDLFLMQAEKAAPEKAPTTRK